MTFRRFYGIRHPGPVFGSFAHLLILTSESFQHLDDRHATSCGYERRLRTLMQGVLAYETEGNRWRQQVKAVCFWSVFGSQLGDRQDFLAAAGTVAVQR
jgi:hypothetical protein